MKMMEDEISSLIVKAAKADEPCHAMQLSQAALNAANAVVTIQSRLRESASGLDDLPH